MSAPSLSLLYIYIYIYIYIHTHTQVTLQDLNCNLFQVENVGVLVGLGPTLANYLLKRSLYLEYGVTR